MSSSIRNFSYNVHKKYAKKMKSGGFFLSYIVPNIYIVKKHMASNQKTGYQELSI